MSHCRGPLWYMVFIIWFNLCGGYVSFEGSTLLWAKATMRSIHLERRRLYREGESGGKNVPPTHPNDSGHGENAWSVLPTIRVFELLNLCAATGGKIEVMRVMLSFWKGFREVGVHKPKNFSKQFRFGLDRSNRPNN